MSILHDGLLGITSSSSWRSWRLSPPPTAACGNDTHESTFSMHLKHTCVKRIDVVAYYYQEQDRECFVVHFSAPRRHSFFMSWRFQTSPCRYSSFPFISLEVFHTLIYLYLYLSIYQRPQMKLCSAYAQAPNEETTGEPWVTSHHDRFFVRSWIMIPVYVVHVNPSFLDIFLDGYS
jgi:hypothetical protein